MDLGEIAEAETVRATVEIMRPVLDHALRVPRKARRNGYA